MSPPLIVIRWRWWGHLLMLVPAAVFPVPCGLLAMASAQILFQPGGSWKAPLLLAASGVLGLAVVIALNALFTDRLELDSRGLRIIGNLYTHDLRWQEITLIAKRHNHYLAPGYHVGIKVDGSNLPRRHWCNLWFAGYFILPEMEKGGIALAAYLKRKRLDYLKHERFAAETVGAE